MKCTPTTSQLDFTAHRVSIYLGLQTVHQKASPFGTQCEERELLPNDEGDHSRIWTGSRSSGEPLLRRVTGRCRVMPAAATVGEAGCTALNRCGPAVSFAL
jgi:hypothetical protein